VLSPLFLLLKAPFARILPSIFMSLSDCAQSSSTLTQSQGIPMPASARRVSLDTWAVLLSLTLALLVRIGILKVVPW
jgi:hypothetical protein